MALLEPPKSGDHHWTTPKGEMRAWSPAPGLVVLRLTGHLETEIAPQFISQYGKLWPSGVRLVVADLDEMVGYDSAFRVKMTEWARGVLNGGAVFHVSVRSKIVQMGVAVANLALGGRVRVHPNRAALEKAARAVLDNKA
jgi:hypothetical protein